MAESSHIRVFLLSACAGLSSCIDNISQLRPGAKDAPCDKDADCEPGLACTASLCRSNDGKTDDPDIFLGATELDFGAPLLFVSVDLVLNVANIGDAALLISQIEIQEDDALTEYTSGIEGNLSIILASRASTAMTVSLRGEDDEPDLARLCIFSNDPDESKVCISLISELKGEAQLCACVLDETDEDPLSPCDPSDELIQLEPSEGSFSLVSLHNCGTENRPLLLDPAGLSISDNAGDGATPFEVEVFEDFELKDPLDRPIFLNPGNEVLYARVTLEENPPMPLPIEDLVVDYTDSGDLLQDTIDIVFNAASCAVGFVDLNGVAGDGCECEVGPELCNGIDDDCDGAMDDEIATSPCDAADEDICEEDALTCIDGALVCVDVPPGIDLCNGMDDDCDGSVDEDFGLCSTCCDSDDTDQCADDSVECTSSESSECVDSSETIAEVCNGIDDDCSGTVDDHLTASLACDGSDVDLCNEGVFLCAFGSAICTDTSEDTEEICNGLDDDCDGVIDEWLASISCDGQDSDDCEEGIESCVDGVLTCSDLTDDTLEICNGADDDCDEVEDEDFGLCANCCDSDNDSDSCLDDAVTCNDIGTADCTNIGESIVEVCDLRDNDCNGVDDDIPATLCDGPDTDLCEEGVLTCAVGDPICSDASDNSVETCNGFDDDCDGPADNGVSLVACDSPDDPDLCEDDLTSCDDGETSCPDLNDGIIELCDGTDNDCNGSIDEGFGLCNNCCDSDDTDACLDDAIACVSNEAAECQDVGGSRVEICNGDDDDCNNATDDITAAPCDGSDEDLCNEGVLSCTLGVESCSDETDNTVEVCNGLDDDCGGSTDEWLSSTPCDGSDSDLCVEGVESCVDGALVCSDATDSTSESCNGLDDDCDSTVDEDFGLCSNCCDSSDTDSCNDDSTVCTQAGTSACVDIGGSLTEACNGRDDDCNGTTDDVAAVPCDGSDTDRCNEGVIRCVAAVSFCSDTTGNSVESCNGLDDDCDGAVDEGIATPLCDGPDTDRCAEGTRSCVGGSLVCSDLTGNSDEICDGSDNDCDGSTDEGFALGVACDGSDADFCTDDQTACSSSTTTACADVGGSLVELCNNLDDDCDLAIDEGFACRSGTISTSGCGLCQTKTCSSTCEFGLCTGCSSSCSSFVSCSCPAGFHVSRRAPPFGGCDTCSPNCGSSFNVCCSGGCGCPSGYFVTGTSCTSTCGTTCFAGSPNTVSCRLNGL